MVHYFYYLDYPPKLGDQETPIHTSATPKANNMSNYPLAKKVGYTGVPTGNMFESDSESEDPSYSESESESGPEPDAPKLPKLSIHARVYALGEKYDIKGLKTLSIKKFNQAAKVHWNSGDFMRAVEEVYTTTGDQDRGMRDAVVEVIFQYPKVLNKASMQKLARRLDLSFDLMMRFRHRR